MAEYIERAAAVKAVLRMRKPENSVAQNRMLSIIQMDLLKLPTADAAPVVRGQWLDGRCTACGWEEPDSCGYDGYETEPWQHTLHCPNCGVKMDGVE